MKRALIVIVLVLLADQALKVYVKTHFHLGQSWPEFTGDGKGYIQLVENTGMAFGMKFGGQAGKLVLTLFRMVAVVVIGYILHGMVRAGRSRWMTTSLALIFAGALGNIIDSAFYGMLFDLGTVTDPLTGEDIGYQGVATFSTPGYTSLLHGAVVDMFWFPLWQGRFPEWLPFWGGESFLFFRPVFNIADAAISVGVALMILVQRQPKPELPEQGPGADPTLPDGSMEQPPVAERQAMEMPDERRDEGPAHSTPH